MTERVIALDPGGRSGWASATMSIDRLVVTGSGVLRQDWMARWLAAEQSVHFIQPSVEGLGKIRGVLHPDGRKHDVIVAESWRPRRKNGSMDWIEGDPLLSAQHLGQIRLIADLSGAKYVEYAPAQKPIWVASMPDKLKALDDLSSEQHDQDARMHLWGYFFTEWFSGEVDPEDCVVV
jgi:hypothetical protein